MSFSATEIQEIRARFPILTRKVQGKPLVYLDNGATTQKPDNVIEAIANYYKTYNANVHRGVHTLSQEATAAYEGARETARAFIGAKAVHEIVFVGGTTDALNLLANSLGRGLKAGDEIVITAMEHHSNIVPWQMLAKQCAAKLIVIPITDEGELVAEWKQFITERTRIVSAVHISNALGTINPVDEIVAEAKKVGAKSIVDGAQAVAHTPVDVQQLGCDFYTFSSHKVFGPTGFGVLYGREEVLDAMPPYQYGGDMIQSVSFEQTTFNDLPYKFEAGTPNIAGAIGCAVGLEFVQEIGLPKIEAYEKSLVRYAREELQKIASLQIIGNAQDNAGLVSFVLDGIHAHDVGTLVDHYGVAIRAGHHCAQPVMQRFGIAATARASFAVYNTVEEVDILIDALTRTIQMFS